MTRRNQTIESSRRLFRADRRATRGMVFTQQIRQTLTDRRRSVQTLAGALRNKIVTPLNDVPSIVSIVGLGHLPVPARKCGCRVCLNLKWQLTRFTDGCVTMRHTGSPAATPSDATEDG